MKKITILFTILLAVSMLDTLQAQTRIGYVNPQEVLFALPEREAIEKKLNEFVDLKEAEYKVKEEAFLARVQDLQSRIQSQTISTQEQARLRASLEEEQEELYALVDAQRIELQRRQEELLTPVLNAIDQAIREVAEELSLDYVLNELTGEGELILLFVSEDGKSRLNITQKVIEKLK